MRDSTPMPAEPPSRADAPADRLRALWRRGQKPDVAAFLAQAGTLVPEQLAAVLRVDQRERWQGGERTPVETYLTRYPTVRADPEAAVDLIYNEFLLRERSGEQPAVTEYLARFPEFAAVLGAQIEMHRALVADDESGANLATWTTEQDDSGFEAGPCVPGYEVLGVLGRGGMGVVYKARQVALNRFVALKMILGGAHAGPEPLRRFRAEAEAVARLSHPNFVQVHDYGDSAGHAYLALEYVEGGTLGRKAAGVPQPPAYAARVVETLAAAIHYAHGLGLVHRDLKPANVLVTADGVHKITDFGLAKWLHGEPGASPGGHTQSGALLGTPAYMAPEQAAGGRAVGPAADVYALGVILYELLTGRPPFQGESVLEVLRRIQEQPPLPPRRLHRSIPRDLETICLKCLEKVPEQRYVTAAALAEDLRRFQSGEPITARPVRAGEHVWRWCRRNPSVASLAALLAVAVLGGLLGVTGLWLRAEHLRGVAETNEEQADADFKLACQAIDDYASRVSENLRLRQEDLRPLRKELLETVVPFYEKLLARHGDRADLLAERGRAYARLAEITDDIEDTARAGSLYEQAVAAFTQLADKAPDVGEYQAHLARNLTRLAGVYVRTGCNGPAEVCYLESLKTWQRLAGESEFAGERQAGLARASLGLAAVYARTGRIAAAQTEYERVLRAESAPEGEHVAAAPEHQLILALGHHDLARLHLRLDHVAEARDTLQNALRLQQQLVNRHPEVADYRYALAAVHRSEGKLHELTGHLPQARAAYRESVAVSENLVKQHGSVVSYREALAQGRQALAMLDASAQEAKLALAEFEKVRAPLVALAQRQPQVTTYQERLAQLHERLSGAYRRVGRWPEAVEEGKRALAIYQALAGRQPEVDSYRGDLVTTHTALAVIFTEQRKYDEAAAHFDAALAIGLPLVRERAEVGAYQADLSRCYGSLAVLHYDRNRLADAEKPLLEGQRLMSELAQRQPALLGYHVSLARIHNNLAVFYVATSQLERAEDEYQQALAILDRLTEEQPEIIEYAVMRGLYLGNLGIQHARTGKTETALETFTQASAALEAVLTREPRHARARYQLCSTYWERALCLGALNCYPESLPDWDRALALEDGRRRATILALRADARARAGDHVLAMTEVRALAQQEDTRPDDFFRLAWACCAAWEAVTRDEELPSDVRVRRAEDYAEFGVGLLTFAQAVGLFRDEENRDKLKTDPYLAALRPRADFQALLREVEKRAKDNTSDTKTP